jgi:hypothetical protein
MSLIVTCDVNLNVQGRLIRIARLDAEKYHFLDDPLPVLDSLKKSGIRVDLFTFMQKLPETLPKYNYLMEWDNLAVLPISTFEQWWTQQIGPKTRNMVRKAAKKGVTLREVPFDDALVRGIWEVYNECPIRQGKPFRHYGKDIETVRKDEATYLDSSIFIGAFLGDKLIGFSKLVSNGTQTQAGLMNIISMIGYRDLSPTNALLAQAVQSCAERGIRYLVYSNFTYGKKLRDSLTDFKKHNGFQQIDLPRYYVPLTRLGSLALRLDLHHRVVDRLPEVLATKVRKIRHSWYNRKVQALTEPS